jgi:phospholipase/carboxylesterase
MIWMHGLGADASDMMGLANELQISIPLRHVFLDAPIRPVTLNNGMSMRAWYDITGMTLTDREDKAGILQSERIIRDVLEQQIQTGIPAERIFLAGFSQGGAMAIFTGLRTQHSLAGLVNLSGYLPLAREVGKALHHETPMFIASGDNDPLVLPAWTGSTVEHLRKAGYAHVAWHRYRMEHSICAEEVHDLSGWISQVLHSKEPK